MRGIEVAKHLATDEPVLRLQIWFSGDVAHAREEFKKRGVGKGSEDNFNKQITAIQREGYPASLDCVIVPALSSTGVFLDQHQIENIVFPPITSAHI